MRVEPIAWTMIHSQNSVMPELGFSNNWFLEGDKDCDVLPEFAGRNCYQSFNKPNPERQTNEDYLKHILSVKHESVLEHSSVTLFADEISRNLLIELERHRHISLSVLSTRYVSESMFGNVIHPSVPAEYTDQIRDLDSASRQLYRDIYDGLRNTGHPVKKAREAARSVLLGSSETKIIVTANLRAWRYVINLRNSPDADVEIEMFAQEVLKIMKMVAPNSFQDMEIVNA